MSKFNCVFDLNVQKKVMTVEEEMSDRSFVTLKSTFPSL